MSTQQVGLIRGINVGRAKRIAMADLRKLLELLGAREVQTVLNSGNFLFLPPPSGLKAAQIEEAMARKLRVSARVLLLRARDVRAIAREEPFEGVADDPRRLIVAFSLDKGGRHTLDALSRRDWSPERLALGARASYLWCPQGIAASPLMAEVMASAGESITCRNWATLQRICALIAT